MIVRFLCAFSCVLFYYFHVQQRRQVVHALTSTCIMLQSTRILPHHYLMMYTT